MFTKFKNIYQKKASLWNGILYGIILGVFLFAAIQVANTLEHTTQAISANSFYGLVSGQSVTQPLENPSGRMRGVTLCVGTCQTVHQGTVTITLNEDGTQVRSTSMDAQKLEDGVYQEYYFDKAYELKEGKNYSFTVSYQADQEGDAIALYIITEGSMETSQDGTLEETLAHQLILVSDQTRIIFLAICIPTYLIFFVAIIFHDRGKKNKK